VVPHGFFLSLSGKSPESYSPFLDRSRHALAVIVNITLGTDDHSAAMTDTVKQKAATPKVALPKLPRPSTPQQRDAGKTPNAPSMAPSQNGTQANGSAGLAALVGVTVRVTNTLSRIYTGEVYSCDTELVLSTGPQDYHIIPISKVAKYEVLKDESYAKRAAAEAAAKEKERETEKAMKLKEARLAKPPGVTAVGHTIFLMLDKTLPVRWHNKSIIVLDNVLIEPPYDVDDCKAPTKHAKQLERVKELVKKERAKMPKDDTIGRRGG